jgi:sugar lactone lactonase YvrE/predicted Ser/Thr protein kinase
VTVNTNGGIEAEFRGYRIEALVGEGGMGVVYRAHDTRLKRTVALKLMAPPLAVDERFRERFSRESELAMALEHPNVVPIYDAGEAGGRLFLAMRYVEGTDLRTRLRDEGALEPAQVITLFKQVAHALDAAHAKGLVHRDVKPSNVLLDADGHAYLADFGLTRRLSESGAQFTDGRSLGTPAYLAPEQIEGRPIDGRADIYSLGCMLYECVTGTAPFSRGSRLAMAWAHLEEEPPSATERNPGLPKAINAVIQKAMAKEPEDRYETCAALVAAAEDALGVSPAGSSRSRLVFAVAAIVVVLAALVGALVARGDENAAKPAHAAKPAPVVRENTLVRIDPKTNRITAVVGVGESPTATAVAGDTVWVYNLDGKTVSEVDAAKNTVRHTTAISTMPAWTTFLPGNVLAADAAGAWVVGHGADDEGLLTRILADGQGKREYRLTDIPSAVAVAQGAVWVVTNDDKPSPHSLTARPDPKPSYLLRVDPDTGEVTRRLPFSTTYPVGGLAIANGAAWVMDSENARLYRVDLGSGGSRWRDLGEGGTPPVAGFGSLWLCVSNPGSTMVRIDPRTFRTTFTLNSLPAEDGHFAVGYGSLWRHDSPSGNLLRFDPETGKVSGAIRISPEPPMDGRGLIPTSVAAGAGSVWITVVRI